MRGVTAPELEVAGWLNARSPIALDALRGRVVVIEVFQLLCPGCVLHGLPQAMRVADTFSREDVAVLGLHSVFEHHAAQGGRDILEAFLHENGVTFPVGMDAAGSGAVPRTMAVYRLRGTPTTILIDRQGRVANSYFGRMNDMALSAQIMSLVKDMPESYAEEPASESPDRDHRCTDTGCMLSDERP